MNIDKAIEINESILDGTYDHRDEDMEVALKLGIEALKELKVHRNFMHKGEFTLLSGETAE